MKLEQAAQSIKPVDSEAAAQSQAKWDGIAKPLGSLGRLEQAITRLSGIQRRVDVDIGKRTLVVMCADNGVVAQGVTQTDSMVTTIMTDAIVQGKSTVCAMAKLHNAAVLTVDIGVARDLHTAGLLQKKVMHGTNDMTKGPAMTREQAVQAVETGIEIALSLAAQGVQLIATGEMGIGNTTSSAAVASVLLDKPPHDMTGCGAGLDRDGWERKVSVIEQAIALNKPQKHDPLDVLAKVGGLDIAGLCGLYIGGASAGVGVMIDGVISSVAALAASRIAPACRDYMIASHISAEPAGKALLDALQLLPFIDARMCLGEGTGAMVALGVLDTALAAYRNAITFKDIDIDQYIHFK